MIIILNYSSLKLSLVKGAIWIKVLYEFLESMNKEKIWLHEATKDHIIFSLSRKENIMARQTILKKKKAMYENLMESSLLTHHEVCKVLKHHSSYGYSYEESNDESNREDMSLHEELIIGMWQDKKRFQKDKAYQNYVKAASQ